jgi:hypothetical protein
MLFDLMEFDQRQKKPQFRHKIIADYFRKVIALFVSTMVQ